MKNQARFRRSSYIITGCVACPGNSLPAMEVMGNSTPQGIVVGTPCASPFMKLPKRPNTWPSMMAGATASANSQVETGRFFM